MDLSVVIVTWNTRERTADCIEKLQSELDLAASHQSLSSEILVVDNGSTDGTTTVLAQRFPRIRLVSLEENRGFAAGNNAAFSRVRGKVILLLNSDAQISARSIVRCLEVLHTDPDVGAVGPRLLFPNGRKQTSSHGFPDLRTEIVPDFFLRWFASRVPAGGSCNTLRSVPALRGAVLFVKHEVLETVGPLCEDYFFFLEDTEWCWRMGKANWRILEILDVSARHELGASSKRKEPIRTRIEYHRSLYRFVASRSGPWSVRGVRCVRALRALGTAALVLPGVPFSSLARERWASRLGVLRWHLRGRPAGAGLAGVSGATPRLDWSPQKGEAPGASGFVHGGGS